MTQHVYKSNQAYELLEDMITFQELAPGDMVSEARLVEITGLGRSPIREALQRLAIDKMIEVYPSKGVLIRPIVVEDQIKLLEVRRHIGGLAIRLAANRANTNSRREMMQFIEVLLDINDITQAKDLIRLLKKIHRVTIEATQNEYLDLVITPLQGLARRFWYAHLNNREEEIIKVANLYALKLRAICCGDEETAVAASLNINNYFTEYAYRTLSSLSVKEG